MTSKTLQDFTKELEAKYPTLSKSIDNETVELSDSDYKATITQWAYNQLADEAKAAEAAQVATDKAAILAKLGIDESDLKTLLS